MCPVTLVVFLLATQHNTDRGHDDAKSEVQPVSGGVDQREIVNVDDDTAPEEQEVGARAG